MSGAPSKIPRRVNRIEFDFSRKKTPVKPILTMKNFVSKIPVRSKSSTNTPRRNLGVTPRTSRSTPSKSAGPSFRTASERKMSPLKRTISTTDDENEFKDLKTEDLKEKLLEEKRHGKKTGRLLVKLHENYQDLLEKFAQAENTIDQLRFKPNFDDEQRTNNANLRIEIVGSPIKNLSPPSVVQSSAVHLTPLSSIQHLQSSPSLIQNFSPEQTLEHRTPRSILSDHEDLLNQSRNFGQKMKSFLTLMDANQLSIAEQKQAYETIRQDYQRLITAFDQHPEEIQRSDLNNELTTMKQLLQDIVKSMTQNLLDKSINSSRTEIQPQIVQNETRSSDVSFRSSLYNQEEILNQYQKVLTAVNGQRSRQNRTQKYDVSSPATFQSSSPLSSTKNKEKHQVYVADVRDSEHESEDERLVNEQIIRPAMINRNEFESSKTRTTEKVSINDRKKDDETVQRARISNEVHRFSVPAQRPNDVKIEPEKITRQRFYVNLADRNRYENLENCREKSHRSTSSSCASAAVFESPMKFENSFFPPSTKENRSRKSEMNKNHRSKPTNNEDFVVHRSFHRWRPEKNDAQRREVKNENYRSSLFISPSRHRINAASRSSAVGSVESRPGTFYRLRKSEVRQAENQFRCGHCGVVSVFCPEKSQRSSQNENERRTRRQSSTSESDTESELDEFYLQRIVFNEFFQRADRIENESKILSRSIRQRLKSMCFARF